MNGDGDMGIFIWCLSCGTEHTQVESFNGEVRARRGKSDQLHTRRGGDGIPSFVRQNWATSVR